MGLQRTDCYCQYSTAKLTLSSVQCPVDKARVFYVWAIPVLLGPYLCYKGYTCVARTVPVLLGLYLCC